MEKLIFDNGIKEYQINDSGVLRFNPSDPNVYARFVDSMSKIQAVEEGLVAKAKEIRQTEDSEASGEAALRLMAEADLEIKKILSHVFGDTNDFDKLLGGVNLLAVANNGERVVTNLLAMLQPIMEAGAEKCASEQADAAVAHAKLNRAQRRALQ